MKWGRKKSAPPSSSSPTNVINRVLPLSWFSMFKHKGCNFDSKNKQKSSFEFPTPSSCALREGRFYSIDEDDAFWRLSFREGRRSTGGINPLWCDSDHDFEFPVSDFKSSESTKMEASTRQECRKFNEMVSDIKKMKEKRGKERIIAESNGGKARICSRKEKNVDDQISRKLRGLKFDDGEEKMSNLVERDIFPVVTENMQHKNPIIDRKTVPIWQDYEGRKKLKEVKIKHESKKKSAYTNRGVKSYSPRTECKVRALEDMKKARTKTKMKERKEEKVLEGSTIFDSVAVAKSSFNPERDFRESMVEMIREKRIGHPQDLEELLACYLTLNCDEYHDLIIKVFRQVWIELTEVYIDPPLQNGVCFDY